MLLTLRIQLTNISKPPVWRKITVPGQFTFHKLHEVIQAAFGWQDYHLYQFSEKGYHSEVIISPPSDDDWQEVEDSRKIKLGSVLKAEGQKFVYIYDFGDDWLHKITVEKITKDKANHAELIGGKGCCPPEDCGGPYGYERLKEIMKNPQDPEHEEMREWLGMNAGEVYDPGFFHLEDARQEVRRV